MSDSTQPQEKIPSDRPSQSPGLMPYDKPRIIYRSPLEAMALVCGSGGFGTKVSGPGCSTTRS